MLASQEINTKSEITLYLDRKLFGGLQKDIYNEPGQSVYLEALDVKAIPGKLINEKLVYSNAS